MVRHRGLAVTRIYGEDGAWLHNGARIRGGEPDAPLRLSLADLVTLRSGFATREDDEWRAAVQRDLTECHRCDVASLPNQPLTRGIPK